MKKSLSIIGEKPSCSTSPAVHTLPDGTEVPASEFRGRAAVVTLGCAKNQVDSEVMLGVLKRSGFEIVSDEFDIPGVGPHFLMTKTTFKRQF